MIRGTVASCLSYRWLQRSRLCLCIDPTRPDFTARVSSSGWTSRQCLFFCPLTVFCTMTELRFASDNSRAQLGAASSPSFSLPRECWVFVRKEERSCDTQRCLFRWKWVNLISVIKEKQVGFVVPFSLLSGSCQKESFPTAWPSPLHRVRRRSELLQRMRVLRSRNKICLVSMPRAHSTACPDTSPYHSSSLQGQQVPTRSPVMLMLFFRLVIADIVFLLPCCEIGEIYINRSSCAGHADSSTWHEAKMLQVTLQVVL